MIRRPPRSTRTTHSFPTRRSSDLLRLQVQRHAEKFAPALQFHHAIGLALRRPLGQRQAAGDREDPAEVDRHHLHDGAVFLHHGVEAWRAEIRSEEHTSELQSLMRISYAVFCLKKKRNNTTS